MSQVYCHWIKRFAEQNYRYEQSRKVERPMWPFVVIMEDNCATWTMTKCSQDNPNIRYNRCEVNLTLVIVDVK